MGHEILKVDDSVIANFGELNAPTPAVLGEQVIGDGTLIRGSDKKIYVIVSGKKVHVVSLADLAKKYCGRTILDVGDDVLGQY